MKSFDEEVLMAAEALRKGKVIVYPTDTIWGLGCDASNSKAVERLFKIKRKKEQNNLIALIDSVSRLEDYLKVVPPIALDLIAFAANPISIVYPGAKNLAKNVMGIDGSVCIRVTSDPFCVALVKHFGKAIASTSANISGEPTPLFFAQISEAILKNADHVVAFYQDEVKAPKASSIIKLQSDGQFTIIRS